MTINVAIYINDPANVQHMATLVAQLQQYNVRCAVLGSSALQGLPNVQIMPDVNQVVNSLQNNNFHVFLSDKGIDSVIPAIAIVQYWTASDELYFNKRYHAKKHLDAFIADLVKARSFVPQGYLYGNKCFLYQYDTDNIHPMVNRIEHPQSGQKSVKLVWNFSDVDTLRGKWLHLSDTLRLAKGNEEAPYNVIINAPAVQIKPQNVIYFCMEPFGERTYEKFIQSFSYIKPIFVGTHKHHLNNAEWHLRPSLRQLRNNLVDLHKTHDRVLSVVVSDKNFDPGHKMRLSLIQALDTLSDETRGFDLHIYGRCQSLNFKHYKGELPDQEKDTALCSYKYHLNVENHYIDNYITEKLYDPLVANTLCFYKGAPNVREYFHEDSFVELSGNINDDIDLIRKVIADGGYEKRLEAIAKAKEDVLYKYSFEPRVKSIIDLHKVKVIVNSIHANATSLVDKYKESGCASVEQMSMPDLNVIQLLAQRCVAEDVPYYIQMTATEVSRLFDKLCFAYAGSKGATMISLSGLEMRPEGLDVLLMPEAAERVLINIQLKRPAFVGINLV